MKAFQTSIDTRFMHELPENVTQQIYINYVFQDFIYKFGNLFRYRNSKNKIVYMKNNNPAFRQQMVKMLMNLEPRYYTVGGDMIQD